MDRKSHNRLVYALCVHGRFEKLSPQLVNWYKRGLDGMGKPKGGPEFWAWKAGHDQLKHVITSSKPVQ